MNVIKPTVILLRGCSGSGKNFTADFIKSLYPDSLIISNDDYFIEKYGYYKWNPKEVIKAEASSRAKFIKALEDKSKVIVIANTNLIPKRFNFYLDNGKKFGYSVLSLIVENRHEGQNIHNVKPNNLIDQEIALRKNILLTNLSFKDYLVYRIRKFVRKFTNKK
jgi:hypothetical protein